MTQIDSIAALTKWIHNSSNLVAFTGAGISTPSGIPDFRSPESGLWSQADAMEVASIIGFKRNPQAFYDWVRPLAKLMAAAEPNPAHMALVELENLGILKAIITQNIDMLHTRAGSKTVFELHGHTREATCIQCFEVVDGKPIMEKFRDDGKVPRCSKCGGVIKPNVILFAEQLPIGPLNNAKQAARSCDLMLIVGSSLEVAPASDLPLIARRHGAKLAIVNEEATLLDRHADLVIRDDAAKVLPNIIKSLQTIS